jgi:hypothetical protein
MLDNLRDQASFQEEEEPLVPETPGKKQKTSKRRRTFDQMTGMNAKQRFVLSVMLLVIVCLLGFMFLVLAGKIVPTFLS